MLLFKPPPYPGRVFRSPKRPLRTFVRAALAVLAAVAVLPLGLWPLDAGAVLIATGDGSGNTTPPPNDPGFENVGTIGGQTGVYLGNGWVLTASHVGTNPIRLDQIDYLPVPGSAVRFRNADSTPADLLAFKIFGRPPLPDLEIANTPPSLGSLITLVGNGLDRGAATSWMGLSGWTWATSRSLRWGTNRISSVSELTLDTHSFRVVFDELAGQGGGEHESDIVLGDSGGAAFIGAGPQAELIGILFARTTFEDQPASTSLRGRNGNGNGGVIVDLFAYRDDILAVVDRPDCSDGLDDDGDGLSDFPSDPGCDAPDDPDERGAVFECDNGFDDDGDQLIDFPEDDGCLHPTNPVEAPEPTFSLLLGSGLIGLGWAGRRRTHPRRRSAARRRRAGRRDSCPAARRTRA